MLYTALKLTAILAALWVLLSLYERRSVYPLDPARVDPAALGLAHLREVTFEANGEMLVLWVSEPQPGKPVVLYFHGNAGNLANRAERFARLTAQGYGLVAMAYRGSGGSTGKPSERAITADATALYDRISEVLPGIDVRQLVLYGESLGSGVVARLVALRAGRQPSAVVLEAPYTSIPDVARHHMPWTAALSWKMTNRWDTAEHIQALRAPLLILHGDRDPVIPFAQGQSVFDRADSSDKQWLPVRGGGHDDLWRESTLAALWDFIDTRHPLSSGE
ncbi:MAG: alpha/beta fold hydrolase [Pseudomonadota bacterium]